MAQAFREILTRGAVGWVAHLVAKLGILDKTTLGTRHHLLLFFAALLGARGL